MTYKLMLKDIRKSAGMTQSELAEKVGVTDRVIGAWERGETGLPLDDACACAIALGCTPNDLCGWEDDDVPDTPPPTDPYESELVGNYRNLTPERKAWLLQSARDGAAMSKSVPERGAAGA